jgi:hypothetical protein
VSDALVAELARLDPNAPVSVYRIGFDYAIFSHKLLSSFYPPNTILLHRGPEVHGPIAVINARIVHDDWKRAGQWLVGQVRYMERELDQLHIRKCGLVRWLRLMPSLMPIAVFLYCLFGKGLLLNGRAGLFYALQRTVAEAVLSLMVLEKKLRDRAATPALD